MMLPPEEHMFRHLWSAVVAVLLGTMVVAGQVRDVDPLDTILREYRAQAARPNVETLIRLDQQLRAMMPYWSWKGSDTSHRAYRPGYEELGVEPVLFESELAGYSGKLLREAHAIDARSQRRFTLYSTVFGPEGELAEVPPRAEAAERYLREFPTGPFAIDAHVAIGTFMSDLFQVLQGLKDGDYEKHHCYRAYLTREPVSVQQERARQSALLHYRALTRMRPGVREFADWLADAQQGRFAGWHYCGE